MMRAFLLILLLALFTLPAAVLPAPGAQIGLSGNLKSYFFAIDPADITHDPSREDTSTEGLAQNKLRLHLLGTLSDSSVFEAAYEVHPVVYDDFTPFMTNMVSGFQTSNAYRVDDFDPQLYPDEDDTGSFRITQNLDRFSLTLSPGLADFVIGRQPVAFGNARLINPTDVLVPYNFNELDTEERLGVDAVRMRLPVGAMGEIDAGLVFGEDFEAENSAAFMRLRYPVKTTDLTLSAIGFKENFLIGLDAARAVGGAGVWIETAWTWAGLLDDRTSQDDYGRASMGVDYNLNWKDGVYVYCEYHYNGASADDPDEYLRQMTKTAYRDGAVYLLGRHYLGTGAAFQVTPLWTVNLSLLVNPGDRSAYYTGALEYNFSENAYLSLGLNIPQGRNPVIAAGSAPGTSTVRPQSEFGLYPALYYTSISFYF